MKNLKKKLGKTGGFTLIEMLIVVAIIAILIAVSIPLIQSSMEKARDATDQANERAAKAEASLVYLMDLDTAAKDADQYCIYSAAEGALWESNKNGHGAWDTVTAYGKCIGSKGGNDYCKLAANTAGHTESVLGVKIATDGKITIKWIPATTNLNGVSNQF